MSITQEEHDKALDLAGDAGKLLLENGAEISRVTETMERIAKHYGIEDHSCYVLSNGIFTSSQNASQIKHIPIRGAQFNKVVAVNQLSRELAVNNYSLEKFEQRINAIKKMKATPYWEQTLGSALAASTFCMLVGGSFIDGAAAFIAGFLLYIFMQSIGNKYMSKVLRHICGSLVATILCIISYSVGFGEHLSNMIIGAIIPLIPGIPFANGGRDIANGDYLAGITRMMDALLIFFCMACGVCIAFAMEGMITGSMILLHGMEVDPITYNFFIQCIAAFIGSVGFAIILNVPRKYYYSAGFCGMVSWMVYILLIRYANFTPTMATAISTVAMAICARCTSVIRKCPVTVFLITGLFPIVPGAWLFWASYYMVSQQLMESANAGFLAIKMTIAIVLGIVILTEITNTLLKKRPPTAAR